MKKTSLFIDPETGLTVQGETKTEPVRIGSGKERQHITLHTITYTINGKTKTHYKAVKRIGPKKLRRTVRTDWHPTKAKAIKALQFDGLPIQSPLFDI